jgi:hypothetical protein
MNTGLFGLISKPSEVYLQTGSATGTGYGSTNNYVRCFQTVVRNTGSGIQYNSDTISGDSFVIRERGIYSVTYSEVRGSFSMQPCITLNSAVLGSTQPNSSDMISGTTEMNVVGAAASISTTLSLNAGDVIRAQDGAAAAGGSGTSLVQFRIIKVSTGA